MTRTPQSEMSIRITVTDPIPGVLLRLQRGRGGLVEPTRSTSAEVTFDFTVRVGPNQPNGQPTFLGDFTQGAPASRFVYVNAGQQAGQMDTPWSRRAKIPLSGISHDQVKAALARPGAYLEVQIPGQGSDGGPTCATVRLPPKAWRLCPDPPSNQASEQTGKGTARQGRNSMGAGRSTPRR